MLMGKLKRTAVATAGVLVCGVVDVLSGAFVRADLLHVLAVAGATWWGGRTFGVGAALALTAIRPLLALTQAWQTPQPIQDVLINAGVGAITLALGVVAVHQTKERLVARAEVAMLRGLLPICAFCKQIRTDAKAWQRIEQYIAEHSEAQFTHGICPACAMKHYNFEIDARKRAAPD
jgi:hypothetical protein